MKKDVIYIDIEDDITAIIAKVKEANEKIVALVPPKRVGVLQSVVNLKLLQRAAGEDGKRIVLITTNHTLMTLASGVHIPVARNLQSKPEVIAQPAEDDDDEDVIKGDELAVGELAKTATTPAVASSLSSAVEEVSLDDEPTPPKKAVPAAAKKPKSAKGTGGFKVPNFDSFRKRLFIIGGALVLLIAFSVWAFVIAPHATVTIMAKTTAVQVNDDLTFDPNLDTDIKLNRLASAVKETKKAATVEFEATGSKQIGQKASGRMALSNASDSDPITVPAGTVFTASNGLQFTSNSAVTVPGARLQGGQIRPGTAAVTVTAADLGAEYNLAARSYNSSQGAVAASGEQMSGGSKETVTVVSQQDVDKAKAQLGAQDAAAAENELTTQFAKDMLVLKESFTTSAGNPVAAPAVGEQAKTAKVTAETTYRLVGVARKDLRTFLDNALNTELEDKVDQRIYKSGDETAEFSKVTALDNGVFTATLRATGYVGPAIDADELATRLVGKRYAEIEQLVTLIDGVESVDTQFSPFWVSTAPGEDKITIKFDISSDEQR